MLNDFKQNYTSQTHNKYAIFLCEKVFLFLITLVFAIQVQAGEKYYEFDASWQRPLPASISKMSLDRSAQLNLKGIHIRNGVFVNSDNNKVKLWGTGLRLTKKLLLSPKEDKKKILENIMELGFNQVRFVGIDFDELGVFAHWEKTGKFKHNEMAGFCEFVELLRDRNMVYSIGINHITSKFKNVSLLGVNKKKNRNKKLKNVQFFDDEIIEETKRWFRSILSIKHPGCNYKLSDDPILYYLNIVNEDSIFEGYFNKFKKLSNKNKEALKEKFYAYIIEKFGSVKTVSKEWGLKEPYKQRLPLCISKNDWALSTPWCNSTIEFLSSIEIDYFSSIKKEIIETGFKGAITTTNNWYGYFNMFVNDIVGDAMETHIYFDHTRRKKVLMKEFDAITNFSFVKDPFALTGFAKNQLFRLFLSNVLDKPLIISEWNHTSWSDYVYEGGLILTAISLMHDVNAMSVHTYLARDSRGYKIKDSKSGLSIIGNPVLYSLLPSLSCAFTSSKSHADYSTLSLKLDKNKANWNKIYKVGMETKYPFDQVPKEINFKQKTRLHLVENVGRPREANTPKISINGIIKSENDILFWDTSKKGNEYIKVKTNNFLAIFGNPGQKIDLGFGYIIDLKEKGAVTICSMDDMALNDSKNILITAVSSYKNTEQMDYGLESKVTDFKVLLDSGTSPQLLKKLPFSLTVTKHNDTDIIVSPLLSNFKEAVHVKASTITQNKNEYALGVHNTPWYTLKFNNR